MDVLQRSPLLVVILKFLASPLLLGFLNRNSIILHDVLLATSVPILDYFFDATGLKAVYAHFPDILGYYLPLEDLVHDLCNRGGKAFLFEALSLNVLGQLV